jgi:hypothetical protein
MVGFEIGIEFQLQHMVLCLSLSSPLPCSRLRLPENAYVSVVNLVFEMFQLVVYF